MVQKYSFYDSNCQYWKSFYLFRVTFSHYYLQEHQMMIILTSNHIMQIITKIGNNLQ